MSSSKSNMALDMFRAMEESLSEMRNVCDQMLRTGGALGVAVEEDDPIGAARSAQELVQLSAAFAGLNKQLIADMGKVMSQEEAMVWSSSKVGQA